MSKKSDAVGTGAIALILLVVDMMSVRSLDLVSSLCRVSSSGARSEEENWPASPEPRGYHVIALETSRCLCSRRAL